MSDQAKLAMEAEKKAFIEKLMSAVDLEKLDKAGSMVLILSCVEWDKFLEIFTKENDPYVASIFEYMKRKKNRRWFNMAMNAFGGQGQDAIDAAAIEFVEDIKTFLEKNQ